MVKRACGTCQCAHAQCAVMWLAACMHEQDMEGGRKSQEDASTREEGSRNKVRGDFVPTVCGIRDEGEKVSESRVKREARACGRNAWHTLTSMSFAPPWYTIHRKTSEVSVVFAAIPKHSTCAGGTITRSAHARAAHTTSAVMTAYTVLRGAIVLAGAEFAVRTRCGEGRARNPFAFAVCQKHIRLHTELAPHAATWHQRRRSC